jgi:hypothetical protein
MTRRRPRVRAERWVREDEAPRLADECPELATLVLEVREQISGHVVSGARYTKHVVVPRAAALFELPCTEPKCEGGGYNLTTAILYRLKSRESEFSGDGECSGYIGDSPCNRAVHYDARAGFRPGN